MTHIYSCAQCPSTTRNFYSGTLLQATLVTTHARPHSADAQTDCYNDNKNKVGKVRDVKRRSPKAVRTVAIVIRSHRNRNLTQKKMCRNLNTNKKRTIRSTHPRRWRCSLRWLNAKMRRRRRAGGFYWRRQSAGPKIVRLFDSWCSARWLIISLVTTVLKPLRLLCFSRLVTATTAVCGLESLPFNFKIRPIFKINESSRFPPQCSVLFCGLVTKFMTHHLSVCGPESKD